LLTIIGIPRVIQGEETGTTLLGDWYANLLVMARQRVLLFTNESTLYSFAVLEVKKEMLTRFAAIFLEQLTLNLAHEDIPPYVIERLVAEYRHMGIAGTTNRSVLGSMNDLADMLAYYVQEVEGPAASQVLAINRQLNRSPHKPLGWKFAVEVLRERLLGAFAVPGPQPSQLFLN
jgi:hypothetical protein